MKRLAFLNGHFWQNLQERSRNLDGELSIGCNKERGTTVQFSFIPEYIKKINSKIEVSQGKRSK